VPWKIIPRQAKAIFAASFIFELQIYNFLAIVKVNNKTPVATALSSTTLPFSFKTMF